MRKTIGVMALLLAFACPAHAGEMQNGVATPSPSPTPVQAQTAQGDIQNDATATLTQIVLTVLVSVLP